MPRTRNISEIIAMAEMVFFGGGIPASMYRRRSFVGSPFALKKCRPMCLTSGSVKCLIGIFWFHQGRLWAERLVGTTSSRTAAMWDEAAVRNKSVNGCFREKSNNPSTFSQIYK
jgi:hypothetical protein